MDNAYTADVTFDAGSLGSVTVHYDYAALAAIATEVGEDVFKILTAGGDLFSLGNYLHMLTADVTADGSGNATLVFEPTLRTSPSNNAALDISTPRPLCGWSMTSPCGKSAPARTGGFRSRRWRLFR